MTTALPRTALASTAPSANVWPRFSTLPTTQLLAVVTAVVAVAGTFALVYALLAQLHPDGAVIAEGPAHATDDWTNGNPTHPYRAELPFTVTQETPATLVLQEDMPQEGTTPREVRVPVVLAPTR